MQRKQLNDLSVARGAVNWYSDADDLFGVSEVQRSWSSTAHHSGSTKSTQAPALGGEAPPGHDSEQLRDPEELEHGGNLEEPENPKGREDPEESTELGGSGVLESQAPKQNSGRTVPCSIFEDDR